MPREKNQPSVRTAHVTSLGCSKNWVDTEIMTADLLQNRFGYTADPNEASLWLINTCGFLASARDEAETVLKKAVKWRKRFADRVLVVAGCLCAYDADGTYVQRYPEVDLWLMPDDVPHAVEKINALMQGENVQAVNSAHLNPYLYDDQTPRVQLTPAHYAWIKITDGCDNCCSYCLIPKIRGKSRSRRIESVVKEAQNLIANGVKELILIGQDITRFGMDTEGKGLLPELLRQLDALPGEFWIRMLYLHPARYSDELTDIYAHAKHLVPYLEMPVQHIAPRILESMNRNVSPERIREILLNLRKTLPKMALRTTFIVGYPGETDAEFEALLDFMREVRFDRVGAFIFEPERGTPAAAMENQVPRDVAQKRYDQLMTLQNQISLERNEALLNTDVEVLIDYIEPDCIQGRTYRDAPDIDNVVFVVPKRKILHEGDFVRCTVTEVEPYELGAVYKSMASMTEN